MAVAASLLRSEMRRHLLMNVGLVASCIVAGTVVTNERGLFVPLGIHSMSETAKAFAAMFTPSHLLPGLVNVQSVTPLEPFDVTADSRDTRRQLMEHYLSKFSNDGGNDAAGAAREYAQYEGQQYVQEWSGPGGDMAGVRYASNEKGDGGSGNGNGGAQGGNNNGGGNNGADAAAAKAAAQNQDSGKNASSSALNNVSQVNKDAAAAALASTTTTDNSTANETPGDGTGSTDGGGNTSTPVGGGGDTTAPVPEPSMWAMMLAGFGAVGYMIRSARQRRREEAEDALLEAENA